MRLFNQEEKKLGPTIAPGKPKFNDGKWKWCLTLTIAILVLLIAIIFAIGQDPAEIGGTSYAFTILVVAIAIGAIAAASVKIHRINAERQAELARLYGIAEQAAKRNDGKGGQ